MIDTQSSGRVLLLFIHGLGGDSTTWGSFPDLLKNDSVLKERIDLEFYRYPSKAIRLPWSKQSVRIQDLSRALRTELGVRFRAYSDVVVIAHSMGGIIAQKYIIDELKNKLDLRVKGLVSFAVPTAGAQLAKWGNFISFRHRHLKQLRKESDLLESIREDWKYNRESCLLRWPQIGSEIQVGTAGLSIGELQNRLTFSYSSGQVRLTLGGSNFPSIAPFLGFSYTHP
jgi:pimeloyl-ACP methyl ester carboxylesterase